MFLEFDLSNLPEVLNVYTVQRRTVWQIVDPSTLLIFAAEGRCRITLDNIEYALGEGHLMLIPAGHHYIRRPVDNEMCTLYYAHIRLPSSVLNDKEALRLLGERRLERIQSDMSGDVMPDMHRYASAILTDLSDRRDELREMYETAMALMLKSAPDSRTRVAIVMMQLLLTLAKCTNDNLKSEIQKPGELSGDSGAPSVNAKLRKVFAYIRLHAKESITLDDLCSVCNFSKQHLIRVFSAEFGMPPKTYILYYRINCAKELFYRNPNLSVKEVADEMGFSDQHYFSRLFTRVSGVTPTAYKQHLINFDPSKQ